MGKKMSSKQAGQIYLDPGPGRNQSKPLPTDSPRVPSKHCAKKAARLRWEVHGKVKEFGYMPDVSNWRVGDLLLISTPGHATDWISDVIIKAQTDRKYFGFSPEDGRWNHSAVYIGDYLICEADFERKVVRLTRLGPEIGRALIRVRRPLGLKPVQRYEMAMQALIEVGKPYHRGEIWKFFRRAIAKKGAWAMVNAFFEISSERRTRGKKLTVVKLPSETREQFICSSLYADAYKEATGKPLCDRSLTAKTNGIVVPAALSASNKLKDVPVKWTRFSPA